MTDNSFRRSWARFGECVLEAMVVGIAVLGIGVDPIKAAELWQFVQVEMGVNDANKDGQSRMGRRRSS
jgi:hypothetical protein